MAFQWHSADFVSGYSCGAAPVFTGFPEYLNYD